MSQETLLELCAVVVAVTGGEPRVLVTRAEEATLPSGPLEPDGHRTLELALRAQVTAHTGLALEYVEQLYTFGDRHRHPQEREGGPRVLSLAYLALVCELPPEREARWCPWYRFFPWEDRRGGAPTIMGPLSEALAAWAGGDLARQERVDICFGLHGVAWDEYRVLERYELLYEAALLPEAQRDHPELAATPTPSVSLGEPMALDHRRILATAIGRLRGKIMFRPVIFELVPEVFSLHLLQRVVEALAGVTLHKQNFRRLVDRGGLVEGTGDLHHQTGGRPAELFRFRREVLRERPGPGVGLPLQKKG
jgi:hypothetical protein